MNEFLTPISPELRDFASQLDEFSLGRKIRFELENPENAIVIIGVKENRDEIISVQTEVSFDGIRAQFYQLKFGNWHLPIYDLGDLEGGHSVRDTWYVFEKLQEEIFKKNSTLIIVGQNPGLIFSQYRALGTVLHKVNFTSIDNRFRLGDEKEGLSSQNYLSKIITTEPQLLFDYVHLGHQTYFVAQEELDLMEELNFDVKRLGKLTEAMEESEPELRNSDMVAINLEVIQFSDFKSTNLNSPNGFNSREICSLARYSGINNKVRSFGVYNYKAKNNMPDDLLMAEILWYFIEGKNSVREQSDFENKEDFEIFHVQIPEQHLMFFHNMKTEQWWLGLNEPDDSEISARNMVPCSLKDYEDSLKGRIPDRWWKSFKKLY